MERKGKEEEKREEKERIWKKEREGEEREERTGRDGREGGGWEWNRRGVKGREENEMKRKGMAQHGTA